MIKRKRSYCSKQCIREYWTKQKIKKNCLECGKEFYVIPSRKNIATFCSGSCRGKHSGKKAWKNHINKCAYRNNALKKYGNACELCNWNKIIEVHHIDNNRENNNLDNLCILCPNHHTLTEEKYINNPNYIKKHILMEMIKNARNKKK